MSLQKYETIEELWAGYKEQQNPVARDSLILHYSPLVKYVASRVASSLPSSVELADLVSYGIFGLIDAIDKFDVSLGFKFETYAMSRVRGAIFDELRSLDWVPRSVRVKSRLVEDAIAKLDFRLGRAPTDEELASELSLTVSGLHQVFTQLSYLTVIGLEELLRQSESSVGSPIRVRDILADPNLDPSGRYEASEQRTRLVAAIQALSDREKKVMTLYYYEGLTLLDISQILGVTEGRVSQIHTKAILQLRVKLTFFSKDDSQ